MFIINSIIDSLITISMTTINSMITITMITINIMFTIIYLPAPSGTTVVIAFPIVVLVGPGHSGCSGDDDEDGGVGEAGVDGEDGEDGNDEIMIYTEMRMKMVIMYQLCLKSQLMCLPHYQVSL